MTFAPLVIAIGSTIATTIIETATGIPLDPIVAKLKDRLAQKLKLGKYEAIDRALNIARNDVVGQCQTDQHRALVNHVLTILLESNSGPLLDEFGKQVATTYLSTTQNNSSSQSLVKLYRQCCGPAILVRQDIPEETVSNLLELFFQAFRERLLIEEDFEYLRSYCQLYEIRKQTSLQQKIVDSLDALVANTAHPVEDFAAIRQAYFNHLINEFKDHTIRGIAPQVGSRVLSLPLAKIFLPLQAVEGRPALAEFAEEDLLRQAMSDVMSEMDWQRRREETEKRLAQLTARQGAQRALKLVDLLRETRVVLLGDPGTGKTTTTRYIAYALAADDTTHTGNNVRGLTPILVRIANYAKAYEQDKTLHLIEYIERELMQRSEFGRYLRYAIEMGQCLIILDGLDEIGVPSLRVEVTQRIQAMVASFSDNQFIVSSRIVGYDQSPLTREFKHATLQDLNQEDREHFISLWYDAINTEITSTEHAGSANDLIDALRAKPPIARMAANPLLLTIMVLMHWRGVKLPSRRVQVYQNATDTLIEYWTAQRHVAELDAEEIKAILAPIAHYILSSGVSGVIAHHELLPRFYAGLVEQRGCNEAEARQLGREMLKNLNEQSGIFLERGLDTNSQPVYGFLHQTFGEYLAAFYLAQQMLNGVFKLELYIHRSIWHEPLLLMAGHLSIINQTRVNTLIRDILDFPALHEEMLQRNLLLAADCLADDVQVNPTLRQEVLERLAKLLDHAATQVREAALNRFRRLAVTRYRELAANAIEQSYQILDSEKFSIVDNQTRINIAKALVALGETTTARPIVWQLDAQQRHLAIRDYERDYEIRKLRFEGWPQEADEYLLQLQANGKTNFSVSAGLTLEKCTLGSIDAATAKLVLGETKLLAVLDALLTHMKGDSAQATLRWIAAITPQMPVIETLLNLTSTEIPPHVRQLAAARLLNTTQRTVGIQVLQELAEHEPTTAASAVKSLLDADEMIILNWNLLCDTALLANHPNAPAAINILLRTGQMNIAVPAAIHLFSTCLLSYNRDQRLNHVMQSLLQHGQSELGLAVARWLALRSGYSYRLQACEALLESGRVTETYPLLQFLAYETHDTASQRACQHLLKYKEGMSIAPLLISVAQKAEPTLRYQACLAMTLASDQSIAWATSQSSRSNLKLKLFHERQQASHTAVNDFIRQAANALDVLTLIDDNAQAAQWLGKLSLLWLEKEANTRGQDTAVKYELNRMPKQALAVIQLNAALFSLRLGQWRSTQQTLFRLHQQAIQMFSLPIQQTLVTILGKIVNHQTTTQILFALTNQDSSVRSSAIRALGTLGDATVLPALITALSDEDSSVRSAAVYALGSLGDAAALPALISILSDEDSNMRWLAVYALGSLGDATARLGLITALSDEDSSVRSTAVHALASLGDAAALPALMTILSDDDSNVRSTVADALGNLGDATTLSALISILSDEDSNVRSTIADALGRLGDAAALPALMTILSDEDSNVRSAAVYALGSLGDATTLPALITALSDENSNVRSAAVYALGSLGDATTLPALISILSDEDSNVRSAAVRALGSLGDATTLPALISILSDEDSNVRSAAVRALGSLGDATTLPTLITALSDEDSNVRSAAARALGSLGDAATLPVLISILSDDNSNVRSSAIRALERLGDATALSALITALSDENNNVRRAAASALGNLGDARALPALITILADDDSSLRSNAASALSRLRAVEYADFILAFSGAQHSGEGKNICNCPYTSRSD